MILYLYTPTERESLMLSTVARMGGLLFKDAQWEITATDEQKVARASLLTQGLMEVISLPNDWKRLDVTDLGRAYIE